MKRHRMSQEQKKRDNEKRTARRRAKQILTKEIRRAEKINALAQRASCWEQKDFNVVTNKGLMEDLKQLKGGEKVNGNNRDSEHIQVVGE